MRTANIRSAAQPILISTPNADIGADMLLLDNSAPFSNC
jgi:hypothetical protein